MARRKTQPVLQPIYVRPTFDARQRAAKRAFCNAAYRGERHRPKAGDFDPLWLRLGLRVQMIESRAGWVVSNPLYDESLCRDPSHDPSLAGPGWLREVYRWKYRDLVTLPGVHSLLDRRVEALRAAETQEAPPPPPERNDDRQKQLFEGAL